MREGAPRQFPRMVPNERSYFAASGRHASAAGRQSGLSEGLGGITPHSAHMSSLQLDVSVPVRQSFQLSNQAVDSN
jgi:hypothetical protein